jgi:hypothetical protein
MPHAQRRVPKNDEEGSLFLAEYSVLRNSSQVVVR